MCLRRRVGRPLLRGETSTPSNPSEVHGDPSPAGGAIAPRVAFASDDLGDLGTADARRLTDQIRAGVRELSVLVLEAHQGRAWLALGYPTWSQYVREEFGFSPSRSYQLLDHARVVQALSRAAGLSKVLDISPYTADRVRPWLEEILATVRDRTRDLSETDARLSVLALVREVVGTNLHRPSSADVRELVPLLELASVLHRLRASLERISRLPFAAWLAAEPSAAAELDDLLVPAGRWLAELESELRSKRPDAS